MLPRNISVIARIWGALSLGIALCLALTSISSVLMGEWGMFRDFMLSILVCLGFALACGLVGRKPVRNIGTRDAIFVVASGWVLASLLGALPFMFADELGLVDAVFESVSGFTTTGSSVMRQLDSIPRSLAMWRSAS